MIPETKIIVGQIMRFIDNARGGFWLVWSEEGRFRVYPSQIPCPLAVGEVITFLPDSKSTGDCRRVREVLFKEPDPQNSTEVNPNERL